MNEPMKIINSLFCIRKFISSLIKLITGNKSNKNSALVTTKYFPIAGIDKLAVKVIFS